MIGIILLGTGVVSMAATASLLTGLLRSAKAASSVTEEEQDKAAGKNGTRFDHQVPRGAA